MHSLGTLLATSYKLDLVFPSDVHYFFIELIHQGAGNT